MQAQADTDTDASYSQTKQAPLTHSRALTYPRRTKAPKHPRTNTSINWFRLPLLFAAGLILPSRRHCIRSPSSNLSHIRSQQARRLLLSASVTCCVSPLSLHAAPLPYPRPPQRDPVSVISTPVVQPPATKPTPLQLRLIWCHSPHLPQPNPNKHAPARRPSYHNSPSPRFFFFLLRRAPGSRSAQLGQHGSGCSKVQAVAGWPRSFSVSSSPFPPTTCLIPHAA